MNPFSSDKAPYAIALLISAIGWMLGGLHGRVQDSMIAAYRVQHVADKAVVTITNLSKTQAIGPVRFKVGCAKGDACLAKTGDAIDVGFGPGGLIDLPAELAILGDGSTESLAYVDAVLPPGASIDIDARLKRPGAPILFQFVPNATKPEALYIVRAGSPFALLVGHYYLLIAIVSGLLVAAFGGWLAVQAFAPPNVEKGPKNENPGPRPPRDASPRRGDRGGSADRKSGQPS